MSKVYLVGWIEEGPHIWHDIHIRLEKIVAEALVNYLNEKYKDTERNYQILDEQTPVSMSEIQMGEL